MTIFPFTVEMMKAIQAEQIKESCQEADRGMEGCREEAWLHYIVDTIDYDDSMSDVVKQAALIIHVIAVEHPFRQANKRTAWVMAKMLLKYHGRTMSVDPDEGERFMLEVARDDRSRKDIEKWIREHVD